MSKTHAPAVRALLRANPDGMTLLQIATSLRVQPDVLRNTLQRMPDRYVDRWEPAPRGQFAAVYCVVIPPPDCPHPKK